MTARNDSKFVTVGKVVKPHGIRGEFCIKSFADSPFLFDEVEKLYLSNGKSRPRPYSIGTWRPHKGLVLMTLEQVPDRNGAEALRGMELMVLASELPEPAEDEFYLHEVEGFRVGLEDGTSVGRLSGFIESPGQDVWVITSDAGREIMLPVVPEFVVDVDMDGQSIVIDPPDGLIDLYENPPEPKKKTGRKKPSKKKASKA